MSDGEYVGPIDGYEWDEAHGFYVPLPGRRPQGDWLCLTCGRQLQIDLDDESKMSIYTPDRYLCSGHLVLIEGQ
jgi:hypothetical protein